jgi:hypothetical protein
MDLNALGERPMSRKEEEVIEKFRSKGLPTHETRFFTGHKLKQGEQVEAQTDHARQRLRELRMLKKLGEGDVQVLRALLVSMPKIPSHHRLRLELLGLVRDGADGLRLTPAGREIAEQAPPSEVNNTSAVAYDSKPDALGRRKPDSRGRAYSREEKEEGG